MSKASFVSTCSVMYSRRMCIVSSTLRWTCNSSHIARCFLTKGRQAGTDPAHYSKVQHIACIAQYHTDDRLKVFQQLF